jgi:hypothetical protein
MRKLMLVFLVLPMAANAGIITYDIVWTGTAGSTMSGVFTFDEVSAADGFVRDRTGDLLSLMLTTSDFGGLSWTWDGNSADPFTFYFDAFLGQFPVIGAPGSTEAQSWNGVDVGPGLGIEGNGGRSGLLIDGFFREETASLTATQRAAVPEPGTLALFGLGLAAIGLVRRRRTS